MNVAGYPNEKFLKTLQQKPEVIEYLERLPNRPARVDFKQYFRQHVTNSDPETFDMVNLFTCFNFLVKSYFFYINTF